MNITLVTPAPPGSRKGNRVTALRWARLLRQEGHRVVVRQEYGGEPCDLLLALHARHSAQALARFHRKHPERPIVLALTGTDVYRAIHTDPVARRSLELAWRLVVLQKLAVEELPEHLRARARVIHQSCAAIRAETPRKGVFEVCVLGHLRPVKDPFRAALAARRLPASSRVQVLQVGAALGPAMAKRAAAEMAVNPRYRWLGNLPRWKALRVLARSRLLVLTSRLEGGANVISEAIVAETPVLSSRIPGSVGILGDGYPGYFPVGDTVALTALMDRAESDGAYYQALKAWCRRLRPLFTPAREQARWRSLLKQFTS